MKSPNTQFDFLPMWQFTLYTLLMSLLVLAFCVLLAMLFNVMFHNKGTTLVVTLGILLGGMLLTQPQNTSWVFAWLPFTYFYPVDVLSGYSSYTYLHGIVTLTSYCLLLYVLLRFWFQKKDIT